VLSVRLTTEAAADPVFGGLPAELATFQWHGDTFDLPDGAVLLAESPLYRNQAFRVGKAYGVQFHLELDEAILAGCAVVPAYVEAADRVLGEGALPGLLREADRALPALAASARVVFERWLDRVVLAPG
jgi:GMP synthase-like glutamine amidotransferase